jgi:hypothetical protein
VLTRRAIPLTVAILGLVDSGAAQQRAVTPPEEVARAVLRADSAGDWTTVLALAHPEALTRFRARQVFQVRMLGAQGWPAPDSAVTDSAAEAHWRELRARQERLLLDSIFQVPDADSLGRTSPDTVYARWVRGVHARAAADSAAPAAPGTAGYRVVGAVKASDTLAYVVMERPLEQPLGPLPEMFRDWPRETHMAVIMVMRRHGREWRSMLDGLGEGPGSGFALLEGE